MIPGFHNCQLSESSYSSSSNLDLSKKQKISIFKSTLKSSTSAKSSCLRRKIPKYKESEEEVMEV